MNAHGWHVLNSEMRFSGRGSASSFFTRVNQKRICTTSYFARCSSGNGLNASWVVRWTFLRATLEAGTGPAIYRSRRFMRRPIIRWLVRAAIFFPPLEMSVDFLKYRRRRSSLRGFSANVSDADYGLVVLDLGVEEIATKLLHHPMVVVQASKTGVSCVGTRYMYVIDSWRTG